MQNVIKDYAVSEMKNGGASTKEIDSVKAKMEQMFTKLQSPNFLDLFNKNMDRLQDVRILGEKGIEITYTIDKNGYIKSTNIHFEVSNKNINKKINIKIPKLNFKNSFNYGTAFQGVFNREHFSAT